MIMVGIDPDLNGGIAVIDIVRRDVKLIIRMPVFEPPIKGSRRVDAPGVYQALVSARGVGAEYVVIENAIVRPQVSSKGPAMMGSVHTVHQTFGALRALSEALFGRGRVIEAWPSSWKKQMGLSSDKTLSLALAAQLYPGHRTLLAKQKNAGIAEAMLLIEWANTYALKFTK